ncbi:hypothetical protein GCM10010191_65680 [Actinomadura vinacea]|uniref:Uncharacterized protein n=1 Tax=Actinomadura vinacea TaxID=115336 RepID=A0ABP5WZU5_9ACTN
MFGEGGTDAGEVAAKLGVGGGVGPDEEDVVHGVLLGAGPRGMPTTSQNFHHEHFDVKLFDVMDVMPEIASMSNTSMSK